MCCQVIENVKVLEQIKRLPEEDGEFKVFNPIYWSKFADNPYYNDLSISDRNQLEWERWTEYDKMLRLYEREED